MEKVSEEMKLLIFKKFYNLMLAFQSDSIGFENGKLYNKNLEVYYVLTNKEISFLNSLKNFSFEEFNHYYYMQQSKIEENERLEKLEVRRKRKEEFNRSVDSFYDEEE